LSLFARYLRNIQIFQQIDTFFGSMRRSRKGLPITEIFKQLLCFFVDGTSRHLVCFDALQVNLPPALPRSKVVADTKRKLPKRRKIA